MHPIVHMLSGTIEQYSSCRPNIFQRSEEQHFVAHQAGRQLRRHNSAAKRALSGLFTHPLAWQACAGFSMGNHAFCSAEGTVVERACAVQVVELHAFWWVITTDPGSAPPHRITYSFVHFWHQQLVGVLWRKVLQKSANPSRQNCFLRPPTFRCLTPNFRPLPRR